MVRPSSSIRRRMSSRPNEHADDVRHQRPMRSSGRLTPNSASRRPSPASTTAPSARRHHGPWSGGGGGGDTPVTTSGTSPSVGPPRPRSRRRRSPARGPGGTGPRGSTSDPRRTSRRRRRARGPAAPRPPRRSTLAAVDLDGAEAIAPPRTSVRCSNAREPVVQQRRRVRERLARLAEHHRERAARPRAAPSRRGRSRPALVNPVFTPIAPGYSHSSTLRFWTIRGSAPRGTGSCANRVATMLANPRHAVGGPREADEVARPSSTRCRPARSARRTSSASCRGCSARAVHHRRRTPPSMPATCSARATAASFADWSSSAYRSSSTRDPLPRHEAEARDARRPARSPASSLTVTTSVRSTSARARGSAVMIFVRLAIGRRSPAVEPEQHLSGVEVGEDGRRGASIAGGSPRRGRGVQDARERRGRGAASGTGRPASAAAASATGRSARPAATTRAPSAERTTQRDDGGPASASASVARRTTRRLSRQVLAEVRAQQRLLQLAGGPRELGERGRRTAARVGVPLPELGHHDRLEERPPRARRSACTS